MPVFYAPDIADRTCLPPEESAHCVRVLRLKEGEEIRLADGKGHFYRARISNADAKQCEVEILEVLPQASDSIGLHLAVAPTKNADRMEWLAEKLTELGIDSLSFVCSSHSERKHLKTDRISKIAVAAMKQSERSLLPEIRDMVDFKQLLSRDFEGHKFIAHCWPEEEKPFIKEIYWHYLEAGQSMAQIDAMDLLWYLEILASRLEAKEPEAKYLREVLG